MESGRLRPADMVTINVVCGAINTPFEYGLIFNKVTRNVIQKNGLNFGQITDQEEANKYLIGLDKKPHSTLFLEKESKMEDADDLYFKEKSKNRVALLNFISQLKANNIFAEDITKLDVRDYQAKVEEMEKKYKEEMGALNSQLNASKKEIEQVRQAQERTIKEIEAKKKEMEESDRRHEAEIERIRKAQEEYDAIIKKSKEELGSLEEKHKNEIEAVKKQQGLSAEDIKKQQKEMARIHEEAIKKQIQIIEETKKQNAESVAKHQSLIADMEKNYREEMQKQREKISKLESDLEESKKNKPRTGCILQ
jgi:chromosome segregation ATPase